MIWPQTIGMAVGCYKSASLLSDVQKRDIFYNNAARFLRLQDSAASWRFDGRSPRARMTSGFCVRCIAGFTEVADGAPSASWAPRIHASPHCFRYDFSAPTIPGMAANCDFA